jgi:hypothetical protein
MTDVTPLQADIKGNLASVQYIYESPADGITATAGGGQAAAFPLSTELSRVSTVATAGDSVQLPVAVPGLTLVVTNHGANAMQVYGNGSDTINDVASATGVSQMAGSECIYACYGAGKWYVNGLGTGYAGSFETQSTANALTAHAGGGQGSAVPITTMFAVVTTVASAGDSVILPASVQGMVLSVANNAAVNAMNVFPATGEHINALSANTAFSVAAQSLTIFYCSVAGTWITK